MATTRERVILCFRQLLCDAKVPIEDSTTMATLEFDSLDIIELAMLLEEEFDIRISDDEWVAHDPDTLTVQHVLDSVVAKVPAAT